MCNRTGRWPVHEPVRTLANTSICADPTRGANASKSPLSVGQVPSSKTGAVIFCRSPGGGFIDQCAHWRILLFCFPVPRKGKQNAHKSPLSARQAPIFRTGAVVSCRNPGGAFIDRCSHRLGMTNFEVCQDIEKELQHPFAAAPFGIYQPPVAPPLRSLFSSSFKASLGMPSPGEMMGMWPPATNSSSLSLSIFIFMISFSFSLFFYVIWCLSFCPSRTA